MMKFRLKRLYFLVAAFLVVFLIAGMVWTQAVAQPENEIIVTRMDSGAFPLISLDFEVYDDNGEFIDDLIPGDLQLLENGAVSQIDTLEIYEPGLHFILAVNEVTELSYEFNGISYLDYLRQAVIGWLSSRTASIHDEFSFISNQGDLMVHIRDANQMIRNLNTYQPELAQAEPSLNSIVRAVGLTFDVLEDDHSKKAILFITPVPSEEQYDALADLAARAEQSETRVFVWVLADGSQTDEQTEPLLQLAERTGGAYSVFWGGTSLPDIETYLSPLRFYYQLEYQSQIRSSGTHWISLGVNREDIRIFGEEKTFELTVLPPNPVFVNPPTELDRPGIELMQPGDEEMLKHTIEFLIEFPDGHNRQIRSSRLFVDGVIAAQNLEEPFTQFEWDIENILETTTSVVQIEVEDSLGLIGISMEKEVRINVEQPEIPWYQTVFSGKYLIIEISLLIAGGILFVVLMLTSRQSWLSQLLAKRDERNDDPLTQPVRFSQDTRSRMAAASSQIKTVPVSRRRRVRNARLVVLSGSEGLEKDSTILLNRVESIFGSDPNQVTCVLKSSSVEAVHAVIERISDRDFMIKDKSSESGTWVNYDRIPENGRILKAGDMIFLGQAAFRFEFDN